MLRRWPSRSPACRGRAPPFTSPWRGRSRASAHQSPRRPPANIACFICRPLLAVGEYHITGKNQSGAPLDATGIWTATDVREGGKWKIRLLTAIPKPPQPPKQRLLRCRGLVPGHRTRRNRIGRNGVLLRCQERWHQERLRSARRNERRPPIGECDVDAGIRRRDVGRRALVSGKRLGEKSDFLHSSKPRTFDKPSVTARDGGVTSCFRRAEEPVRRTRARAIGRPSAVSSFDGSRSKFGSVNRSPSASQEMPGRDCFRPVA